MRRWASVGLGYFSSTLRTRSILRGELWYSLRRFWAFPCLPEFPDGFPCLPELPDGFPCPPEQWWPCSSEPVFFFQIFPLSSLWFYGGLDLDQDWAMMIFWTHSFSFAGFVMGCDENSELPSSSFHWIVMGRVGVNYVTQTIWPGPSPRPEGDLKGRVFQFSGNDCFCPKKGFRELAELTEKGELVWAQIREAIKSFPQFFPFWRCLFSLLLLLPIFQVEMVDDRRLGRIPATLPARYASMVSELSIAAPRNDFPGGELNPWRSTIGSSNRSRTNHPWRSDSWEPDVFHFVDMEG